MQIKGTWDYAERGHNPKAARCKRSGSKMSWKMILYSAKETQTLTTMMAKYAKNMANLFWSEMTHDITWQRYGNDDAFLVRLYMAWVKVLAGLRGNGVCVARSIDCTE